MKRTNFSKFLSVLLSLLMVLSVTGVALPLFAPEVKAEGINGATAELNALAAAMNNDTVKNIASYGSISGNNATINDPTGEIIAFAEAYWNAYVVVAAAVNTTITANTNNSYRTSTQVRNEISTAIQGLFLRVMETIRYPRQSTSSLAPWII